MILQRFRWELTKGAETIGKQNGYQRCLCGLVIEKVEYMRTQRVDMNDRSQFLNLLTFFESDQRLDLQFSDQGGMIKVGSKLKDLDGLLIN